jgi:hypothetical protein
MAGSSHGDADRAGRAGRTTRNALQAGDCRRDLLSGGQRHQVTSVARGLPAVVDGLQLLRRVGESRSHPELLDSLHDRVRLREGRTAQPTAAIADSQTIKAAETVGSTSRGFDAGKKINGRKRHIVVDTLGLLLARFWNFVGRARSSAMPGGTRGTWTRCGRSTGGVRAAPYRWRILACRVSRGCGSSYDHRSGVHPFRDRGQAPEPAMAAD